MAWGLAAAGLLHAFKGWPVAALLRHGKGILRQEGVEEVREVTMGLPKARLLLARCLQGDLCSQGGRAVSLGSRAKAVPLSGVRVVPAPLVSPGRRSEGKVGACGFPGLWSKAVGLQDGREEPGCGGWWRGSGFVPC